MPRIVDAATADTALFLLLGALRLFNAPMQSLRVGEWRGKAGETRLGRDPEGKVVGVLGMGGGKEGEAGGAEYKGFEELLGGVDVLSVNVPLNVWKCSFPPPPPPRGAKLGSFLLQQRLQGTDA